MRFVPVVTILAGLAAVAAGCGGGRDGDGAARPPDAPSPTIQASRPLRPLPSAARLAYHRPAVPAGFRARRVPEAGAQVAVPIGWIALTRLDAVHPGARQTLAAVDTRVAGPLAALGVPDSPLKLLVLAPVRGGRFPATITLVVSTASRERSFAAFARRASGALLAGAGVRGPVARSTVRLPVGDAVRLRYRGTKGGADSASVAYLALGGGQAYYLALTSKRHEPGFTRAFDTLARSLTTVPGSVGVLRIVGPQGTA